MPSATATRFDQASRGFLARIQAVAIDQWGNPSPCPNWSAQNVVAHVINEQRRTLASVHNDEPEPIHGVAVAEMGSLPEIAPDADLAAAWAAIGEALTTAIDDPACQSIELPTPMGPTPFGQISEVLPEDVLIHTWDLARATGGDERLDADLVAHVYEHLKPLDEMLRQPWAFGPKVATPPDADLQTEFLCFVGRQP